MRNGSRVQRARFESLTAALGALEASIDELAPHARRASVSALRREYDAALQVAVRGELAGPGGLLARVHGGVDLRGDGSAEAFTGRWRRRLVELKPGETPYDGLLRALEAQLS